MAEEETETETETETEAPHTEAPHTEAPHTEPHHISREEFEGLRTTVGELTAQIQDLTQRGEQDTTPVRRPWTHRGGR